MTTSEKLVKIAAVVPEIINVKSPTKIKRGEVHALVCKLLRLSCSNGNIKLIKAVLEANGIREVIIHGQMYYSSHEPRV